ncbi:MAG TPA: YhjD/YihY/BrkB family envelope integrity protein, partial [Candidatus Saccharimonadales bacterium]|nr:YhjD/YihY/BrkB family envelope integrity protein [Candidatus Saccharimonadales bacterium]
RIIASLVSAVVLFVIFWVVFKVAIASSAKFSRSALFRSALAAAIGIQILQIIGGYLITHELSKLTHLYGTFAATLGLLFWIYLQARIVMYSVEYGSVFDKKLWPRSLTQANLTSADRRVYSHLAKKERVVPPEDINVDFNNSKP